MMSNMGSMDPKKLARLEQLLERQDILDCLLRFCRAMDRFDRDLFLSQGQSSTLHYLLNHTCEIDGEVAHAETYYLFTGRNRDETNWTAGGRYIGRLERRDGAWKIAFRTNAIEWSGMVPTTPIPFLDVPDVQRNGAPSRSREDPSYRRPLTNSRRMTFPPAP